MKMAFFRSAWMLLLTICLSDAAVISNPITTNLQTDLDKLNCPIDLTLLVDMSGSICQDLEVPDCQSWQEMKTFLKDLIRSIKIGGNEARVAMITFGSDATLEFNLDSPYSTANAIIHYIDNLRYVPNQHTATERAIQLMMDTVFGGNGDRSDSPNIAVVVSDGLPTDVESTKYMAERAQAAPIKMFAVGATDKVSTEMLRYLSSEPREEYRNYFKGVNFVDLSQFVNDLRAEACDADCIVDLTILVDRSGSICSDENVPTCDAWERILAFLEKLIGEFSMGDDGMRVALIIFDTEAHLQWNFDSYTDKTEVVNAVKQLKYDPYHTTNVEAAFRLVRSQVNGQYGDRPEAQNVILLVSDGHATFPQETLDEADRIKLEGSKIYTIGVGMYSPNVEALKQLSSPPKAFGQNYFTYMSEVHEPTLANAIQVDGCEGRERYYDAPDPPCAPEAVDVMFLLDTSHGICEGSTEQGYKCNWNDVQQFVVDLVRGMTIGPDHTRVAMMLFGTAIYEQWGFDRYDNVHDLENAVRGLEYIPYQGTHTATAIRTTRDIFRSSSRPHSKKITILVTHSFPTTAREGEAVIPEAMMANDEGIRLIPVGVETKDLDRYILKMMAGGERRRDVDYFLAGNFEELHTLTDGVLQSLVLLNCLPPRPPSNPIVY